MTTRSDGQVTVEGSLCSRVVRPFTDGSDGQKLPTGGDARVSALSQKPGMALRYGFKGMGSDAKATDTFPCVIASDRTASAVPDTAAGYVALRLVRKATLISQLKTGRICSTDRERNRGLHLGTAPAGEDR
jgi:hypothetical protein